MSNAIDCAQYFLGLGDSCPTLADVQAALASGEVLAPLPAGVGPIDNDGLVTLDAFKGTPHESARFALEFIKPCLSKTSREWAIINWNCGEAEFVSKHPTMTWGECYDVRQQTTGPSGSSPTPVYVLDLTKPLAHTNPTPNHILTVADAVAYWTPILAGR